MPITRSPNGSSSAAEVAPLLSRELNRRHIGMPDDSAQLLALGHKPELERNHTKMYCSALEIIEVPWTDEL